MSGFEVLAWNVEISGETLSCSEPKITKILNGKVCDGEYQVQIENTLENRKLVRLREEIKFLYEGEEKFRGIIGPSKFEDTIEIRGKSVDKKLDWTIFSKDQGQDDIRRVQYDNTAANVILGDILSGTSFSIGACPSTLISMRFEYGRRRKCAKFLAERLGKDFWVSPDKKVYIGDKGVTREKLESFVARSHIEDPDRITNKLYCLGYGDGINQLSVVVEDTESQGEYGLSENAFVDRRFIHQDSLEAYGNFKVAELKDPIDHVPIEVPYTILLDEGLEVGDTIPLENYELKLSGNYRIQKIGYGGEKAKLQVARVLPSITEHLETLREHLQSAERYAQGATNIYQVGYPDNASDTKPMTVDFYIPPETIKINRVKVNFKRQSFRAYAKSAASKDLGTKTSEGGGSHRHYMFKEVLGSPPSYSERWYAAKKVDGGDILCTIEAESADTMHTYEKVANHQHDVILGSHSHNIIYGIYEKSSPYGTIAVGVNGTVVGSYGNDQSDLDVSEYCGQGWNYVKLTPNSLARIVCLVYIQIFIQSK